jgi:iron(III) transport system substrate-binding protein
MGLHNLRRAIVVALMAVGLAGPVAAADLKVEQAALYEKAKAEGSVMVYTSINADAAQPMFDAFKKAYPDVKLSSFRAGSGQVLERFLSEFESGVRSTDVMLFHGTSAWGDLKAQGAIMKYDSPVYELFPDAAKDPGYTTAGRTLTGFIAYNTKLLSKETVENTKTMEDWVMLAERPELKGRFSSQDVVTGGGIENVYAIFRHYGKEKGEALLKRLFAAGMRVAPGGGVQIQNVASGQEAFSIFVPSHLFPNAMRGGDPVNFTAFSDGIPVFMSPMSIAAHAPHPNAAKLFFNWWNSDGQALLPGVSGAYSARTDIAPPEGFPPLKSLQTISVGMKDWPQITAQSKDILATISRMR